MPIPVYDWFDQAPEHYKTRNQLGELGLKPGGPVVARVEWDRGRKYAKLYDQNQAIPKRQISPEYRAKLDADKLRRRTCPVCKRLFNYILYSATCSECHEYNPDGMPDLPDGALRGLGDDWITVWLPIDAPPGPIDAPTPEFWIWYSWVPYPKTTMRLWADSGAYGPFLPGHTHAWVLMRQFHKVIAEWDATTFAQHAEQHPILREWAIDAGMPGATYLDLAMAGLPKEDAAELRVLWYEKRVSYYQDMKKYRM